MGLAQGLFDELGGSAAGKDEAQVARPFRQRNEHLFGLCSDQNFLDSRYPGGAIGLSNFPEDAGLRDGNHHDARGAILPPNLLDVFSQRQPDEQLLERYSAVHSRRSKSQRSRAEAADRARGYFHYQNALRVDSEFGVKRPVAEPERPDGSLERPSDGRLDFGREP